MCLALPGWLLTIFEVFDSAEDAAGTFNPLAGQVTPGEY
jgi:hypothetical protein